MTTQTMNAIECLAEHWDVSGYVDAAYLAAHMKAKHARNFPSVDWLVVAKKLMGAQ